jgi:hypothetical protein
MFIGHFATGLAAKKVAPNASLGTLFLAAQFIDLLWPVLLLLGIESVAVDPGNTVVTPLNFTHYPISHSMLGVLFWAVLFGGIYFVSKKDAMTSVWLSILVFSHWLLDLFTHRPDLPLAPGQGITKVGLGLWNSLVGTLVLELGLFAAGIYLYLHSTKSKNKTGLYAFWVLIVFLLIVYVNNIFGPPPPADVTIIGFVGLSQWLLVIWAYWIDRNRESS